MLPRRNLEAIEAVGANLRPFSFGGFVRPASLESPALVNLIYRDPDREKTVYSTTHLTAINRPMDHTREM